MRGARRKDGVGMDKIPWLRTDPWTPEPLDGETREHAALRQAVGFAVAAIIDAIYTEDGLDGETGEAVLCLLTEALKDGTFDARTVERAEMLAFFNLGSDTEAT